MTRLLHWRGEVHLGSPKNPPKSAILDKWPPQQIADFASVGPVAQVVEHVPFKHRVAGSSPARLTNVFCEFLAAPTGAAGHLLEEGADLRTLSIVCAPRDIYASNIASDVLQPLSKFGV